ncbi:MAG: beta-ketoacyl-[acyl-carrier-protein] synthase family protein [Caldilinea sp.]
MTRVFITGMGAVTPIGNDVATYWQNLIAGYSGAAPITAFDPGDMPYNIACEVKGYTPPASKQGIEAWPRATQFALSAARQALANAGLEIGAHSSERIGVFMATGGAGLPTVEIYTKTMADHGWRSLDPASLVHMLPSEVSTAIAVELGVCGPVMTHALACASGHYSVLEAYHFLQRGEADVFIAGGSESSITPITFAAFGRMGALASRTDDPSRACRPFSVDRDGLVAGEGAAAVVLETETHARGRGATLYAEVVGGKLTGDAYHVTAPDPESSGAIRALTGAMQQARVAPEAVDVVYAHGTGTRLNDGAEALALRRAFGAWADKLYVTSIKSMIGHGFGAAGAQSLVAAVHTLREGIVPPTINYTPDPAIDIHIVGNVMERVNARHAIVNAFGFGGHNVVLVIGQGEG